MPYVQRQIPQYYNTYYEFKVAIGYLLAELPADRSECTFKIDIKYNTVVLTISY